MITLLRFGARRPGIDLVSFVDRWRRLATEVAGAPSEARPVRAVVATTVPGIIADPVHDGVVQCWFDDADHLARYETWAASMDPLLGGGPSGHAAPDDSQPGDDVVDRHRSPAVVAEARVVRGADWLAQRWIDGGPRLKHMALAVRADGLTPAEFSDAWAGRAGAVAAPAGGTVAMPDEVKGDAYVQDHPLRRADGWSYDAVNEVYLDAEAALRRRQEWFDTHLDQLAESALFGPRWFLAVREELVGL